MNRAFSPEVRGILSGLNIDVFVPGTGELRSFSEILGEISDRWQEFDDATKQSIACVCSTCTSNDDVAVREPGYDGCGGATQSLNSFGSAAAEMRNTYSR